MLDVIIDMPQIVPAKRNIKQLAVPASIVAQQQGIEISSRENNMVIDTMHISRPTIINTSILFHKVTKKIHPKQFTIIPS